jgi:hypothetical protein
MKRSNPSKLLASAKQVEPQDAPLTELGALAKREHVEADSATDELDTVFVAQTTEQILAALSGSTSPSRGSAQDWLERFKSWLSCRSSSRWAQSRGY